MLALVLLIASAFLRPAGAQERRRVVVIHSYHQGLSWVDAINRGIVDALSGLNPPVALHFEYMDTKRHMEPEHLELLRKDYRLKYRRRPPDLFIVCDNNAFDLVREWRDDALGGAPVVFCGVNGFRPDMLAGLRGFTGVAENVSFGANLRLIRRLHPGVERIVVYGGGTPTYRINKARLTEVARDLGLADLLEFVEGRTISQIRAEARKLPADAVLLLISSLRDDDGSVLAFATASELLSRAAPVPLYSMWDIFLGHGIVGGKLVSGRAQGETAGEIARRILEGEPPDAIPVVTDSPNPYLFDYEVLRRFRIPESSLPQGSAVIRRPPNLLRRYRALLAGAGAALLGALLLIGALLADAARRRRAQREVKATRDFLQTVIDGVAEPILVIDPEHRVRLMNRAARETACPNPTGDGPAEPRCHALAHGLEAPCDGEEHQCPVEAVHRTGEPLALNHVRRAPDGKARHLEILASPLRDRAGRFAGIVQSIRDVTDRVEAFEQIRRAKEEWERTFDAVPDLIALIDRDHRILRVNRAMAERLGVHPREVVGLRCFEVMHRSCAPPPGCPHSTLLRDARSHEADVEVETLGGVFLVSTSPLRDEAGRMYGSVHVARDVTAEKEARAELARQKERLRVTLESLGEGVIATDPEGRITLMNTMAGRLTGWPPEEALGRALKEVFPLAPPPEGETAWGQAPGSGPARLESRDGVERLVVTTVTEIPGEPEKPAGTVIVFRDVTEERRRESERARTQHLESLGVLAGGIAHDFNNLLMAIAANLEAARRKTPAADPAYRRLSQAEAACFRATELTRQLLTFARGGEPVRRRFQVGPLLEEWGEFALRGSNVAVEVRVDADLWAVDGDPGQIEQVVTNLVINARQAMPGGGTVRLRAANHTIQTPQGDLEPGAYVCLEVSDEGLGIPPEHLPRIFDPYFTTKQTGSGLGLAMVHSIVKRHGGAIRVESRPGTGTAFRIYLPAVSGAEQEAPSEADGPAGGGGRVLVMDDEEMIRDVVQELLEDIGYRVEVAADGTEAVERYRAALEEDEPFDAVILDLTVPAGMGGREALEHLKEIDPDVRAVASSGYASDPVLAEPQRYGFLAAVPKPYRISELARVLQELIAAPTRP